MGAGTRRSSTRVRAARRVLAVASSTVLASLAVTCGSAAALKTRVARVSFGVAEPTGVAVEQSTGDVYVIDAQAEAVRKFDANGKPVNFSGLGSSELKVPGLTFGSIAVDSAIGDIYVGFKEPGTFKSEVQRFGPSGEPADFTEGPGAGTNVLTGEDTPSEHLGTLQGLAVDESGDLFASQSYLPKAVDEFTATGKYAGFELTSSALEYPNKLALDSSGDIYIVENGSGNVLEFSSFGSLLPTFDSSGLANDASVAVERVSGTVLISHKQSSPSSVYLPTVAQYSSSAAEELGFRYVFGSAATRTVRGLAVNSTSAADPADQYVYAVNYDKNLVEVFGPPTVVPDATTRPASEIGAGVATVNGTINTAGTGSAEVITDCHFEYVTEAAYKTDVEGGGDGFGNLATGGSAPCSSVDGKPISKPSEIPDDGANHTVSAEVSGLAPNTTYHFRLQASNSNGANPAPSQTTFLTPGPATIESTYVTNVGASTAEVAAEVNPHLLETSYSFQYVDDATYRRDIAERGEGHGFDHATFIPSSPADLGDGSADLTAAAELTGLSPSTTYHYRVIAINAFAPEGVVGPARALRTQPSGFEFALPDNRAWELVSPPNKHGGLISGIGGGLAEAATDGSAITYLANGPVEEGAQGNRLLAAQILSRRGPHGWSSEEIVAPNTHYTGFPAGTKEHEYIMFSRDLALGVMEPISALLSPEASGWTPYVRQDFVSSTEVCPVKPSACWTPLLTSQEGYADVQPPGSEVGRYAIEGGTPDATHVILVNEEVEVVGEASTALPGKGALYEWSAAEPWRDRLAVISKLPASEGETTVDCASGGISHLANPEDFGTGHATSEDGSRVFFEVSPYGSCGAAPLQHGLYVRDTNRRAGGATLQIGDSGATFQVANGRGSRVLFTDTKPLTPNSGQGDLYLCEIMTNATTGELECTVTDITPKNEAGESAEVQGQLLGAGENAEYVYFAANGLLGDAQAQGANRGDCASTTGTCNLYVYHAGETRLIAAVSGGNSGTNTSGDASDWSAERVKTSRVSPAGRWLAFMSRKPLTGYDNHDVASSQRDEEVYLYNDATGRLFCASCNPTGARPEGEAISETSLVNGESSGPWAGRWVAAAVPSLTIVSLQRAAYQSRYLSNGGRLFFDSHDALAPHDKNGAWDVYEYEPPAAGAETSTTNGCTTTSAAYSEQDGGCVSLISSGADEHESAFLDASESGDDVFFLTAAKLWPHQDYDTAYDVYDAHVCTSESPCIPEPVESQPCTEAESCRAAPQQQPSIFGPPPSVTFSGKGDIAPAKPKPKKLTRKQKLKRALKRCDAKYKHNRHKRRLCKRRVRKRFLTRKQRLRLALRACRHGHRHEKVKMRFCMRRARHRLRHHAHASRRHDRKTGSRRGR